MVLSHRRVTRTQMYGGCHFKCMEATIFKSFELKGKVASMASVLKIDKMKVTGANVPPRPGFGPPSMSLLPSGKQAEGESGGSPDMVSCYKFGVPQPKRLRLSCKTASDVGGGGTEQGFRRQHFGKFTQEED